VSGKITVRYLQEYIRAKDYHEDPGREYFLKLAEEVGELGRAIRKEARAQDAEHIKGTIAEELWDVMYYALALANLYDVDLEQVIPVKEALNAEKYRYPEELRFRPDAHAVLRACEGDIEEWMALAVRVKDNFPGFEEASYRETVLRNMARGSALCVRIDGNMAGILLFSGKHQCLSYMAVAPEYRRMGVGSALVAEMLRSTAGDVRVDTFREGDPMGEAPRALYKRFGFIEGELLEDFGYPVQRFYRKRGGEQDE